MNPQRTRKSAEHTANPSEGDVVASIEHEEVEELMFYHSTCVYMCVCAGVSLSASACAHAWGRGAWGWGCEV